MRGQLRVRKQRVRLRGGRLLLRLRLRRRFLLPGGQHAEDDAGTGKLGVGGTHEGEDEETLRGRQRQARGRHGQGFRGRLPRLLGRQAPAERAVRGVREEAAGRDGFLSIAIIEFSLCAAPDAGVVFSFSANGNGGIGSMCPATPCERLI